MQLQGTGYSGLRAAAFPWTWVFSQTSLQPGEPEGQSCVPMWLVQPQLKCSRELCENPLSWPPPPCLCPHLSSAGGGIAGRKRSDTSRLCGQCVWGAMGAVLWLFFSLFDKRESFLVTKLRDNGLSIFPGSFLPEE